MGTNIGMMAGRRTYRAANSSIFITAANKTTLSGDTRDLVRHRDEVWRRKCFAGNGIHKGFSRILILMQII